MNELLCWNCGENLADIPRPISRHATCGQCFNELHCCRLCQHYDPKKTMQCFEDRADPPIQKENANFCDFYSPQLAAFEGSTVGISENAKGALDALFSKGALPDPDTTEAGVDQPAPVEQEATAKKKLDDLFR